MSLFGLLAASLAAIGLLAGPAEALVINVTTTTDGGAGSLREAIETLATNGSGDEVVLQPGATYVLTCGAGGDLDHGATPLTLTETAPRS